jgi:hypothetical protein
MALPTLQSRLVSRRVIKNDDYYSVNSMVGMHRVGGLESGRNKSLTMAKSNRIFELCQPKWIP